MVDANYCEHFKDAKFDIVPKAMGCEECLKEGRTWVNLRQCLICGHIGCCNSSEGKHAWKHFESTGHPVVQSFVTDETWKYCYVDKKTFL